HANPDAKPSALLSVVNAVLYENVRDRLHQDEHATLSLIRYARSGKLTYAGAHEEIVVCRKASARCELLQTPGTWVAATRDISEVSVDTEVQLEDGDLLVLYTDGVLEAADERGELFGIERLCQEIERVQTESVEEIRDHLTRAVQGFLSRQEDDIAVLVARY